MKIKGSIVLLILLGAISFPSLAVIYRPATNLLPNKYIQNSCFNKDMMKDSLECPHGESVLALDNRFQMAGVFLSYLNKDGITQNLVFFKGILKIFSKIKYRGIINIIVAKTAIDQYVNDLKQFENLKINTLVVENLDIDYYTWNQDALQFAYRNNNPVVILQNYISDWIFNKRKETALLNLENRIAYQVAQSCGLEVVFNPQYLLHEPMDGSSGGNFTPLPGNNWLTSGTTYDFNDYPGLQEVFYSREIIGNFPNLSDFLEPAQMGFAATVGDGNNIWDLPSGYMGLGHIDEVVSIIPTTPKSSTQCDFVILKADPGTKEDACENCNEYDSQYYKEKVDNFNQVTVEFASQLSTRLGCEVKIKSVPIQFKNNLTEFVSGNQLNGLVIQHGKKTSFVTTSIPQKELSRSFKQIMKTINPDIELHLINGKYYYEQQGGIHCATASIRVCK